MREYILFLLVAFSFFSCKERKVNQLSNNETIIGSQTVSSNQEMDIDGYYIPVNRFLIGKYSMESLLVNYEKPEMSVELNLVDSLSGETYVKRIMESSLKRDSLLIHLKDDNLGELFINGSILMSPVNNPSVKEKSTIVMKGKACLNGRFFDVEFTYFAGD